MPSKKQDRHYMLRSADDFQGFHVDPKETTTIVLNKLVLVTEDKIRPEKDWEFQSRVEAVKNGIQYQYREKYDNPIFRVRVIWRDDMETAEIVIHVISGTQIEGWETKGKDGG